MGRTGFLYLARTLALAVAFIICSKNLQVSSLMAPSNHSFDQVKIAYAHEGCSFLFSPVDFCDERHIREIKSAIRNGTVNFNNHYMLLTINEWNLSNIYGNSVVAIDLRSGMAYPMPFDYFSSKTNARKLPLKNKPQLIFSKESDQVCIDGSILVYRATSSGLFCFRFVGDKFVGYRTEYMN
nr:hypothetical protein [Burkholderia sp. Ac-20365]